MKELVIIGAGGFGREIYNTAMECEEYGSSYTIKGFIDNLYEKMEYTGYPPILGRIDDYIPQENDVFVCALGDVKWKKRYVQMILDKGGKFITLIHKTAYISKNVKIGQGCLILADTRIQCDAKVGDYVTIQPKAIIGHDVVIEDWCMINAFADCGGASYLEEGATLHTHSFIMPTKRVGANAVIGACSFAVRNVKPNTVVLGVPAKELALPKM